MWCEANAHACTPGVLLLCLEQAMLHETKIFKEEKF
jgi:hypothetical protein